MNLIRPLFLFIAFSLIACGVRAQRGNIWCFGDSAGIDFSNLSSPYAISSTINSRGTCASVCDSNGQLLFTASTNTDLSTTGCVTNGEINRVDGSIMPEGDSLVALNWYQEMTIIPDPINSEEYYIFSVGVTTNPGLWYCKVDMTLDNGLGAVTQKNVQLLNFLMVDCILAIKHGNGRDWWLLVRPSPAGSTPNNTWNKFLINSSGIISQPNQNIGSVSNTNSGTWAFSPQSNKLSFINVLGIVEIFDFDRCSGTISNTKTIEPQIPNPPYPFYWISEFSESGRYLYVSSLLQTDSKLWQYDTWSPNIFASKTLIWQTPGPPWTAGALKRGPDSKIYFSCAWVPPNGSNNYPYDSTMYYTENMNLSVINSPDSAGLACDFQPWSFYLGGKRTYWGLPNNPDYDLPALAGSPCDTLVGIGEAPQMQQTTLNVFYHTAWEKAFINASNLKGKTGKLLLYDMQGKVIHSEPLRIQNGYYTKDLSMIGKADGVYLVVVETERELLTKKMVVN